MQQCLYLQNQTQVLLAKPECSESAAYLQIKFQDLRMRRKTSVTTNSHSLPNEEGILRSRQIEWYPLRLHGHVQGPRPCLVLY